MLLAVPFPSPSYKYTLSIQLSPNSFSFQIRTPKTSPEPSPRRSAATVTAAPPLPPSIMSSLPTRHYLCFLVLQFLDDEKLSETSHKLEKESGVFFNLTYFEELVMAGRWADADSYLAGFTAIDDNRFSATTFFEIRRQNYLEALDRHDKVKAVEILSRDLKVFESTNQNLYKDMVHLLALDNFRENYRLANYGDTNSARAMSFSEIKKVLKWNPVLHNKLQFPILKPGSLRSLLNQSVNRQHHQCKAPLRNSPLYLDHSCEKSQPQPSGSRVAAPVSAFDGISQLAQGQASIGQTLEDPPTMTLFPQLGTSNSATHLNRPLSPSNNDATKDHLSSDHEDIAKRPCIDGPPIEVINVLPTAHLPVANSGIAQNQCSLADLLPKGLAVTLEQGSMVMSMDFHPSQLYLLLVGTNVGDMILWDVALNERLAYGKFSVWDLDSCSYTFQVSLIKDSAISVNKVAWSHDGSQFGVAHSKHLVHLYTFNSCGNLVRHLEIDAHVGGVNDLAFSQPNRQVTVVTCGDDKLIKVWDTASGSVQFTFQSDTPVYSICPHAKMNIQFVLSASSDGKIKAWVFGNSVPKVDYSLPGHACSRMAYTDDGTRLFSCGTSKEGETCIVEWDESDGLPKRTYVGFRNASKEVVQFDTTKNRFLAAGDDFLVKFWDMDETTLLATTDAEGGLPASPCIRFNKSGSLLAVSTSDNCIKILANVDGLQLLCSLENESKKNGDTLRVVVDVEDIIMDMPIENSKPWKVHEINEPSQCCSLWLPECFVSVKVPGLVYMNSGTALLALGSNGVHKLWKWPEMAKNYTGQATTSLPPVLWKPPNAENLTNELSNLNREEAHHCFALSKNDSYILSTSGGKISLFNMLTFKTMFTSMPPHAAATCIAFYPQDNNIIVIGTGDGSINIYNMRSLEVKTKLKGHWERITGLAFSSSVNVLISAGLDARLCIWATDRWNKKASILLQIPNGRELVPDLGTRVQFHNDFVHFLVGHGLQLAIYDAKKLERSKQWIPPPGGVITDAAYSCDGEMIFATFIDGSVSVFTAALQLRCRINPTAYPSDSASQDVYPLVVAAHPSKPNQFALGLTNGDIYVFEPLEAEGKWGTPPPEGEPL